MSVSPDGTLGIADLQLQAIGVGPDGTWLGPLTETGAGPGEVGFTAATAWTDDGALAVLDVSGAKVVLLDPAERVPVRLIEERPLDRVAFAPIAQAGQVAGVALDPLGTAYFQKNEAREEDGSVDQVLLRFSSRGADTIIVVRSPALAGELPGDLPAPAVPRLAFAVGPDGRIADGGETAEYRIRLTGPGTAGSTICRPSPPPPIRPDEFGEELDAEHPFRQPMLDSPRPESPAAIGRLLHGRDGTLWVERDRPNVANPIEFQLGRPGSTFDVFDPDGAYLGELVAPEAVRIVAATGDRAWGFEAGPFDVTWVVAYRLVRAG